MAGKILVKWPQFWMALAATLAMATIYAHPGIRPGGIVNAVPSTLHQPGSSPLWPLQ